MRNFASSVTDLRQKVNGPVESFPFECGWAEEAVYFVTVESVVDTTNRLSLRVQLSADGLRWADEGSLLVIDGVDTRFVRVRHFGGFLRLVGESTGEAVLTIRLALKG